MNEFAFPVSFSHGDGLSRVTAFSRTRGIYQADETHPHWEDILKGLRIGDHNVWALFDVASGVMSRFNEVSERISYNGSEILFDGDPIHSVLASQLIRAIEDKNPENYTALAKFWEKLASNPSEHSREQAYEFLSTHDFQITADGDVVGYKGVVNNDGEYVSGWASTVPSRPSAYVDGNPVEPLSRVPQPIGSVVTMPRSEVVHDPSKACERGLHVATRAYATAYGTVLEVHVNPRDIVSVPSDASGAKVRVCRYKVARVAVDETDGPVLRDDSVKYDYSHDVSYRG